MFGFFGELTTVSINLNQAKPPNNYYCTSQNDTKHALVVVMSLGEFTNVFVLHFTETVEINIGILVISGT